MKAIFTPCDRLLEPLIALRNRPGGNSSLVMYSRDCCYTNSIWSRMGNRTIVPRMPRWSPCKVGASMCISGDIADVRCGHLCEHRRRGIQGTLLGKRLVDAGVAGMLRS